LKPEELQVLRAQYEKEGEYVGLQTKFNYAWVCASRFRMCYAYTLHAHADVFQGLIKSNSRPDQQEGVRLLSEIFRNSRERRRECLYYLALGNYKLGNYAEARRYNDEGQEAVGGKATTTSRTGWMRVGVRSCWSKRHVQAFGTAYLWLRLYHIIATFCICTRIYGSLFFRHR
jgi:hypothetical protein